MLLSQSAPSSEGVFASGGNVFQEFPMWVKSESGESKIVSSQDELDALGDGWIKPETVPPVAREKTPEFVEYPKWVGDVIVNSAEEEAALLGSDTTDERAALIQIAAEKGVKIDKRWSDDKIRAALVTE